MEKIIQENFSAKNPSKTLPKYHDFAKYFYIYESRFGA
jgi:hypothetical protein